MIRSTLRAIRDMFLRPSVSIGLGVLVTGGFIAGAVSWHGFNTAMDATNQEEFCLSCHTMRDNLLPELQKDSALEQPLGGARAVSGLSCSA
ncbi:MAG: NapC/NirT family cytochrome c [Roseovarius sp.]|nr:NapC/NirT family cytochrome c [Roseovarius sp.]